MNERPVSGSRMRGVDVRKWVRVATKVTAAFDQITTFVAGDANVRV